MRTYYFRAHDRAGHKHTGTIEASDRRHANATLRDEDLRPYFLFDYHAVKKAFRRRKKRAHILVALGVAAVLLSFPVSTFFVRYAERERAPDIEDYKRTGIVTGAPGIITAKGKQERQFAQNTYEVWETYCPGTVTGVEVTRLLVGVYVNKKVRSLADADLELLAIGTVKAHHRQLGSKACTLLIVEETTTIVEAEYNVLSGEPHVKFYD